MRKFILLVLILAGCGLGDESKDGLNVNGNNNVVITVSDSQVIQSCAGLFVRAELDCDDDEVKLNCEMCFEDTFREELDLDIEGCIAQLTELGYCE